MYAALVVMTWATAQASIDRVSLQRVTLLVLLVGVFALHIWLVVREQRSPVNQGAMALRVQPQMKWRWPIVCAGLLVVSSCSLCVAAARATRGNWTQLREYADSLVPPPGFVEVVRYESGSYRCIIVGCQGPAVTIFFTSESHQIASCAPLYTAAAKAVHLGDGESTVSRECFESVGFRWPRRSPLATTTGMIRANIIGNRAESISTLPARVEALLDVGEPVVWLMFKHASCC
jgi:hypothetical protein